ncbi:MAG: PD-(D/E)XK nuclease family protein [Lewinella sp.]
MTILLGLTLSDPKTLPSLPANTSGMAAMSPTGLLRYLEGFYALGAPTINREALRTEQYRQLINAHQAASDDIPFYQASFKADQGATAAELLSRRDELLAAGYPLSEPPARETPQRITTLHELEALLHDDRYDFQLLPGTTDRLILLLAALSEKRHPGLTILVNEPRHLLPPGFRRLLLALEEGGDQVAQLPEPEAPLATNDLGRWQQKLSGRAMPTTTQPSLFDTIPSGSAPMELVGDGSLILLKAERETHLAAYVARLLRDNKAWRPGMLLSLRTQTLDNALVAEGLPSLGIPSASLARPSLQVLKLITTFLWKPIEVERVMEFVSLVTKPLHWRLGQRIAEFLADTPGLFGPRWYGMLNGYFTEMEVERGWSKTRLDATRAQYDSWFDRRRYPRDQKVPKFDLRDLLNSLREWALEAYSDSKKKDKQQAVAQENTGLLVLAAQAQRAMELLDAQPETELSYLDVERLIRTVYEPAPTQFQHKEDGAPDTVFAAASVLKLPDGEAPERIIWWDFIEHEPDYFFSRYYPEELAWLKEKRIQLNGPDQQNELSTWRQLRPVLHARKQLILCLPERVDGSVVEAHPLLGDLEAAFADGALDHITVAIDAAGESPEVLAGYQTPGFAPVPVRPLAGPVAQLHIDRPEAIRERDPETPTALEDLLYYPYKWVFRHQLKLKGRPILSVAGENRLRGNLSHLFIEQLLNKIREDNRAYTRGDVRKWVDDNWLRLLRNEGAILLEYGQEPERVQFVRTMQYAAWSLVHYIQANGWEILGSEEVLAGELERMGGQPVKGRADLVLKRDRNGLGEVAIVDLKWRGKTVFKNLLRNAKDVQLCLYAEFIQQHMKMDQDGKFSRKEGAPPHRVHTAYYVLRDALMVARNELAFANIETVASSEEAEAIQVETLKKVRATANWRWEQFREGVVEVRCQETLGDLEDLYLDLNHDDLLEMEEGDARFDDYRSLIGLVR